MPKRIKPTQDNYIERVNLAHGGLYQYERTVFKDHISDIIVTCSLHGDFEIQAGRHLYVKRGCPKCSNKYRPSTIEFIERSHAVHDNKYDYTKTEYVNNKTKVVVTCPEHGDFSVSPIKHSTASSATGCPICARTQCGAYHKKDTSWFIEEARKVHGNKYDYSKVVYASFHKKVEIICPEHGSFFQTAAHIQQQHGCNKCSYKDYEGGYGIKRFESHPELKDLPGRLYLIECSSETEHFYKIGITRKTVDQRFNGQLPYNYNVVSIISGTMFELFALEQQLKKTHKSFKYRPEIKFCGHTECLSIDSPILDAFKT